MKFQTRQHKTGKPDVLGVEVPQVYRASLLKMLQRYNGNLTLEIKAPLRTRTTGDLSQNHKIAILVAELSEITGYTEAEVKDLAKLRAIPKGYPYRTITLPIPLPDGRREIILPKHEPELSTVEAGKLIDELELMKRECS